MDALEENIRYVMLHWVRCTAMIGPLPIFGSTGGSRVMRLGLGVMLGTIMALALPNPGFIDPGSTILLVIYMTKEMLLGLVMGFVALLCFATLRLAGDLIGTEMGFNMANIQDPVTGVNTQLMAHYFEAAGMVAFFIMGAHHTLFRALAASFETYPVSRFTLTREIVTALVQFSSGIFVSALRIAAPVFAAMIVVAVALAILARVAPQLQIMVFAFPVKILSGMFLVAATISSMIPAMGTAFTDLEIFLFEMLRP